MAEREESYLSATRHPWPCLLFLLPLLAAYEGGVIWLGGKHPESLRNGVDAWLRWGLGKVGLRHFYWVPALLAVAFGLWSWLRRGDRPKDLLTILSGMVLESVLFALGLWAVGHGVGQLLDHLQTAVTSSIPVEEAVGQVVTFVGAGIYEEALFRLLLFTGLLRLLDRLDVPPPLMLALAALASSAVFAAAHHIGPYGEPFDSAAFVFRLVAGVYFALLYQVRGFGIAAGAHALYDVLAGVSIG